MNLTAKPVSCFMSNFAAWNYRVFLMAYPDTYEEVTKIAPVELANDFRPEPKTKVDNMEEYDILIKQ